jgi:hypothetical protein
LVGKIQRGLSRMGKQRTTKYCRSPKGIVRIFHTFATIMREMHF